MVRMCCILSNTVWISLLTCGVVKWDLYKTSYLDIKNQRNFCCLFINSVEDPNKAVSAVENCTMLELHLFLYLYSCLLNELLNAFVVRLRVFIVYVFQRQFSSFFTSICPVSSLFLRNSIFSRTCQNLCFSFFLFCG